MARFCSDSPKYFPSTVDLFTGITFRWNSAARAKIRADFPQPGGPNSRNLDGAEKPQFLKTEACCSVRLTASRSFILSAV